jgi:hypothetical protein
MVRGSSMGEGGIIVLVVVAVAVAVFLSMLIWLMQPEKKG